MTMAQLTASDTTIVKQDTISKEKPKKPPSKFEYGVFGESFARFTPGFDEDRLSSSFGGGLRFEFISVGFAVHKLQSDIYSTLIFPNSFLFESRHGAGFLGLRVVKTKFVHGEMRLNIGKGDAVWQRKSTGEDFIRDEFDLLEPEVIISVTPFKYLHLMINAGYRKVKDLEIARADNDDLSGITFGVGVKIGFFN